MALSDLTMLLNFLVLSYHVHADVIRDDGYNNYGGQFTVVHKGRMLRVLMYFNHIQLETCALHCVRHLRCRTINYHHVKKACELTDEDFDEKNVDTISPGWYNHGTPPKVDGEWSSWRNYTECTKTCENGTLEQWRDCDSPKPENGGAYCNGKMRRRVKCNTQECPVVNVALNKRAKQSSTQAPDFLPSRAIDGNTKSRSLTRERSNQWWEVDIGEVRLIKEISLHAQVYFRSNRGVLVETRKSEKESWHLCYNIGDVKKWVTKFKCNAQSENARFLRIRSSRNCHISIYELEIFAYYNN